MSIIPSLERQRLVVALAKRGLNFTDMCRQVGINKATLSQALAHGRYYTTRRRIDLFLGEAILTPEFEFSHHNMVRSVIGVDPITTTGKELRKLAESRGIKAERLNRTQIVTALVGSFASEPKAKEAK